MVSVQETPVCYRHYVLCVLLLVCVSNLATRNLPSYLITVPVPNCERICKGEGLKPLCGSLKWDNYPSERLPTQFEACQLCRARLVWVDNNDVAGPKGYIARAAIPTEPPDFSPQDFPLAIESPLKPRLPRHRHFRRHHHRHQSLIAKFVITKLSSIRQDRETQNASQHLPSIPQVVEEEDPSEADLNRTIFHTRFRRAPDALVNHHGHVFVKDASYYSLADGACLGHSEYGILIGYGFAIVFAIGSLPAGWICDRNPRVAIASAALTVWSVATAMQSSANSFSFLLICRAIVGLAQAFAMPAVISLTADYFKEKQNVAEVVLSVGLYLGSGCASFSIIFATALGWRWAVFLSGLAGLPLTALLYNTVKEPERTEWSAPCALNVVAHEVYEKSRVARMLIVAASAKMLAAYSLGAFLPIWYVRSGMAGYGNYEYAYWNALVISAGGVLSALVGSACNHYWSKVDVRAPCWIGFIGSLLSLPLICMMFLTSYFLVSISCFFVLILVSESWFGPSVALLQASVRRSVRGQAVSMFLVASTLVANTGPAMLGFIDPGTDGIGLHLLWISVLANIAAATAFWWTAQEIGLDPVAAGFGDKAESWPYRCDYGDSARLTIGAEQMPVPPRGTTTPWGFF